MSVIIRLQNLSWAANTQDIRQFFKGMSIPEGGVHIVGGELGDAFIAFSTDEDARQAMQKTGGSLKGVQISLQLSSRSEMQKVIEQARQQALALQGIMGQTQQPPLQNQMPQQPTLQNPMPQQQIPSQSPTNVPSAGQPQMQQNSSSLYQPPQIQNSQYPQQNPPQPYGNQPSQKPFQQPPMSQPFSQNSMLGPYPAFNQGQGMAPPYQQYGMPYNFPQPNQQIPNQPVINKENDATLQSYSKSSNRSSDDMDVQRDEVTRDRKDADRDSKGRDTKRHYSSRSRSHSRDRDRKRRHRTRSRSRERGSRRRRSRSRERNKEKDSSRRDRQRDKDRDKRESRDYSRSEQEIPESNPPIQRKDDALGGIPGLGDIPPSELRTAVQGLPPPPSDSPIRSDSPSKVDLVGSKFQLPKEPAFLPKHSIAPEFQGQIAPVNANLEFARDGGEFPPRFVGPRGSDKVEVNFKSQLDPRNLPQMDPRNVLPGGSQNSPHVKPGGYGQIDPRSTMQIESRKSLMDPRPTQMDPRNMLQVDPRNIQVDPRNAPLNDIKNKNNSSEQWNQQDFGENNNYNNGSIPSTENRWKVNEPVKRKTKWSDADDKVQNWVGEDNKYVWRSPQFNLRGAHLSTGATESKKPTQPLLPPPVMHPQFPANSQRNSVFQMTSQNDMGEKKFRDSRMIEGDYNEEHDDDDDDNSNMNYAHTEETRFGERRGRFSRGRVFRGNRTEGMQGHNFDEETEDYDGRPWEIEKYSGRGRHKEWSKGEGYGMSEKYGPEGFFGPPGRGGMRGRGVRIRGRGRDWNSGFERPLGEEDYFPAGRGRRGGGAGRGGWEFRTKSHCVEMRNFHISFTYKVVRDFFHGLEIDKNGIKIPKFPNGNEDGTAFIRFSNPRHAYEATCLSQNKLNGREIGVYFIDDSTFDVILDKNSDETEKVDLYTSCCVVVSNLPSACTYDDMQNLFELLRVKNMVLDVEGPEPRCFVLLITPQEARKAVFKLRDTHFDDKPTSIRLCRENDYQEAVNKKDGNSKLSLKKQTLHVQKLGNKDKNQPDMNSNSSKANKHSKQELLTDSVVIKGVPVSATESDIRDFIKGDEGITAEKIHFCEPGSDKKCEVFVVFPVIENVKSVLKKNNQLICNSRVSVSLIPKQTVMTALGLPFNPFDLVEKNKSAFKNKVEESLETDKCEMELHENLGEKSDWADASHPPERRRPPLLEMPPGKPPHERPDRHFGPEPPPDFGQPGCIAAMSNVPYRATTNDVLDFFSDFPYLRPHNIIRRYNELNQPMADFRVAFRNAKDAYRAVKMMDRKYIFERMIRLGLA